MTKIINILGGPGSGKSTTAADLYRLMKLKGYKVELVREIVKEFAYAGIKPDLFNQVYLFGKQSREESKFFGKVDYIITDSPLYLASFYESYYNNTKVIENSIFEYIKELDKKGIMYNNFMLYRTTKYETEGRFETELEAKQIDNSIKEWLDSRDVHYTYITNETDKAYYIMKELGL